MNLSPMRHSAVNRASGVGNEADGDAGNRKIIATLPFAEQRRDKMATVNFEQLFDRTFPIAANLILTVTEVPEREEELIQLLERAMLRGLDNRARLTEIHLPMERFPFINSKFWHVPVEDCGKAQVLRFFFEPPEAEAQ
jgi:hypothetical protein